MSPDPTNEPRSTPESQDESKKAPPVSDLPPRDATDASAEQTRGGFGPIDGSPTLKK